MLTALGIPFSVWLWRSVRRQESRIGRLQASGVVAVAEILAVTPATVGKTRDVALDLRLTASGIEAYDATILCAEDERLVVGETMAAVIEPSSKDFTVESDLVRGERVSL
ncbi:hypothetical protein [Leifsonia poae]|uniref:hypothetical protein n=1 Tax=Leifsonia poae TaxID=110933 RepID=UPI003D671C99